MTDVLLLQPPVSFTNHLANAGENTYPLGLSYLSGMLKRKGISVRTINNVNVAYSIEDLLDLCESEKIKILGISSLLATIRSTIKIARAVKGRFKDNIHVLLGNAYVSTDPDIINRYPYFDSAIDGEADFLIIEHVNKTLQGEKLMGFFKASPPLNLDELAFPAFENCAKKKITKYDLSSSFER